MLTWFVHAVGLVSLVIGGPLLLVFTIRALARLAAPVDRAEDLKRIGRRWCRDGTGVLMQTMDWQKANAASAQRQRVLRQGQREAQRRQVRRTPKHPAHILPIAKRVG